MLQRNNTAIDFNELERRVVAETGERVEPEPAATPAASAGLVVVQAQPAAVEGRRSLRRRLVTVLRAVADIRPITRRCIAALYAAEYAQPRLVRLEAESAALMQHRDTVAEQVQQLEVRAEATYRRLSRLTAQAAHDQASAAGKIAELVMAAEAADRAMAAAGAAAEQAMVRAHAELAMVRREVMFQQRRLTRLGEAPLASHAARVGLAGRHDSLYAAFEDVFRGGRADIKQRMSVHVARLALAGAGAPGTPVVDIGCGRGEWLELLGERGMAGYGIDTNAIMVERCVSAGLDARQEDLLTHLGALGDASRSAVTAFHVVEHLPFEVMVDFIDEALRVLVPGGIMVLETPNAETMRVGATTFYNDGTHGNPVLPQPLRFIVEHRGFTEVEIVPLHPFTQGLLEEPTADARLLNRVLFGPQDYALVARRP